MFDGPKVEVHITNIHKRESIYHHSLISTTATGVIAGLGTTGYVLAIDAIADMVLGRS
jgi:3-dehydroquinate dehydratase II